MFNSIYIQYFNFEFMCGANAQQILQTFEKGKSNLNHPHIKAN